MKLLSITIFVGLLSVLFLGYSSIQNAQANPPRQVGSGAVSQFDLRLGHFLQQQAADKAAKRVAQASKARAAQIERRKIRGASKRERNCAGITRPFFELKLEVLKEIGAQLKGELTGAKVTTVANALDLIFSKDLSEDSITAETCKTSPDYTTVTYPTAYMQRMIENLHLIRKDFRARARDVIGRKLSKNEVVATIEGEKMNSPGYGVISHVLKHELLCGPKKELRVYGGLLVGASMSFYQQKCVSLVGKFYEVYSPNIGFDWAIGGGINYTRESTIHIPYTYLKRYRYTINPVGDGHSQVVTGLFFGLKEPQGFSDNYERKEDTTVGPGLGIGAAMGVDMGIALRIQRKTNKKGRSQKILKSIERLFSASR